MPQENNKIIETLADMNEAIGNRFDRVDEQFTDLRGRIDRVEQRVGGVEQRLERMENILLEDIQRRVEILEQKVDINR